MANFTAADVKKLRDATGAGMMDCKKALTEADGDFDKAVEALRIKGAKSVDKRADRTAAQGMVVLKQESEGKATLIELNCETDFVAKNAGFIELANEVADFVAAQDGDDIAAIAAAEIEPGKSLQAYIEGKSAIIGEKLELRRIAKFEGAYVASYLHKSDPDLPPSMGVLVELDKQDEEVGKDLAQQIAALAPQYVSKDEVPADVVANERRIAEETARNEGKPEQALPKIVEGRLNGYFKDICLLEQPYAKDDKVSISQLLAGASIARFAQVEIG